MRYLLDANVISELMRPEPSPVVVAWLEGLDEDTLFLSVVTMGELRRGVEMMAEGRRKRALNEWVTTAIPARFEGRVLDVDTTVAEEWGRISAAARRAGRPHGDVDSLIAATAAVHDCIVVSRDGVFAALGVDVFNPWNQE